MSQRNAIDIAYDAVADRIQLVLRHDTGAAGLLLTRRFVKAFLARFSETLETSLDSAHADRRAAVGFEHLEAVGEAAGAGDAGDGAADQGGGRRGDWPDPAAFTLAVQVNVQRRDAGFDITIVDTADQERRFTLTRVEAHRILSAVARKAEAAEWDLEPYMGWLDEAGSARAHLGASAGRTAH